MNQQMMKEDNDKEAVAAAKKNTELHPENPGSWLVFARRCSTAGDFSQAEAAYTKAIEFAAAQDARTPLYSRGYIRWYQGKYGPALEDFLAIERSIPSEYDEQETLHLLWHKAQLYEALGGIEQAISLYRFYQATYDDYCHPARLIRPSGLQPPAYFDSRRAIQRLETWKQTKLVYSLNWGGIKPVARAALELPEKTVQDSLPLYRQGQHQEAAALFKQVVDQMPENDRAWRYLGHAQWYAGEETEAIQAFEKAYQLDPQKAANCFCQGCVQYMKQEYREALEKFNQAENLILPAYNYPRFYQFRADTHEKLGDLDAAIRDYRAYDVYTGQPLYREHIKQLGFLREKQIIAARTGTRRR